MLSLPDARFLLQSIGITSEIHVLAVFALARLRRDYFGHCLDSLVEEFSCAVISEGTLSDKILSSSSG